MQNPDEEIRRRMRILAFCITSLLLGLWLGIDIGLNIR